MTQDNWIKEWKKESNKLLKFLHGKECLPANFDDVVIGFVTKQLSLEKERTNKRWREKIEKLKPVMEDDEETTVYRHCDEGDHWKCSGYGENGTCLCKCHALSDLLK